MAALLIYQVHFVHYKNAVLFTACIIWFIFLTTEQQISQYPARVLSFVYWVK